MIQKTMNTASRLASATVLMGSLAFGQAPNPTQTNILEASKNGYPVFRVTAVSRSVSAINYHHRQGSTVVGFQGSSLAPKAKGEARVDSKTGATKVEVRFDKLPPAQTLGNEFLTYVLWAVTPEGRFQNMGEVYLNGDDAKLQTSTELQAFGMIVTAEPYYAVTQPSDVIVLENVVLSKGDGKTTTGTIGPIEAKYDLLQRGAYAAAMPQADRNLTKDDRSDSPLDLKEARFAMDIANGLGARVYAEDTMKKAEVELMNAEAFWKSTHDKKRVQTLARVVTQLAEDARLITVKRREEEGLEAERVSAARQVSTANANAQMEAERGAQAQRDKEAALLAERQAQSKTTEALASAESARAAAEAARIEALRMKQEAELAQQKIALSQRELELQRAASEQERARLSKIAEQAELEKNQLRDELRQQFNLVLETRDTARGLVVNMSDVLFDTGKHTLRAGAREKLAKIAGIVLAHPGLKLDVEGHTDSVGSDEMNQVLSERRANSVSDYLTGQGIAGGSITAKGLGETSPVTDNNSAAGRQQNRRVELVVSGDIIERRLKITSDNR